MNTLLDAILDVVFWFVKAVIGLLPNYSPPDGSSIQLLIDSLATFNNFFPAIELVECIIAYLAFCGVVLLVKPMLSFGRLR